jgi:hypothetical protein
MLTAILFVAIAPVVAAVGLLIISFPYRLIAAFGRTTFLLARISGTDPYDPPIFSRRLYTPVHEWFQGPYEGLWDRMRDNPRSFPRVAWLFRIGGAFLLAWSILAMAAGVAAVSD